MAQYFKTNVAGDLTGNLPQPTVAKIQGTPVSVSAPTTNQIFSFTGSNWTPTAFPLITNVIEGYTSTAAAGATTTLSNASTRQQYFTGTTQSQTVRLPVTTTLTNGQMYLLVNNTSSGILTVQTGGASAITTINANGLLTFTCINNSSDVAASWSYSANQTVNLSNVSGVLAPINGGTGVSNSNSNTITLGGSLSTSGALTTSGANSLTLTTTATTNVTFPTSGTLVNTAVATLSSLTSIGTITTGTWNGSVVGPTYGGTGVNNGANTITLGGSISTGSSFTTSGVNPLTLTTTGATNVTLPTTGTLVNSAVATLSSLTSIGTITTGTWNGTAIAAVNGGTGNTVYAIGDLLYASTTSALSRLADVATGQVLVSGGVGAAPAYSANPTLTGLTLSGLTASQAVVTNGSNALVSLSYTAAATASTLVSRDANANSTFNNAIENYATTATAAGTTTLTVSSAKQQYFTGSTTQTVRLPVTTTLVNGQQYMIVNNSTGVLSIQTGGASAITTISANTANTFTCVNNGTDAAASWSYTGVTASLSGATGVLLPANGGTGVANSNANTITVGGAVNIGAAFTTSANALTLTTSGATNVTLPTSGTLVNSTVATLSSLTSIGTITTGTWNGSVVGPTYGGTGVNNGSSTITLAANFATSGANSLTLTTTGPTNVTLPTTGTLVNSAVATLSSLTSIGTITTGTWNGTAVAAGFGGTGSTSAFTAGGVVYGMSTSMMSTTAAGTSGQVLQSAGAGTPTWTSTPTFSSATISSGGNITVSGGGTITGLPTTPVNPTDAASKAYVDSATAGLSWKSPAAYATTTSLPSNTYSNGASGVGATLTATANGILTVDGTALSVVGTRVLVKNEAAAANNGIYQLSTVGTAGVPYVLTRTTDGDLSSELNNAALFVTNGSANMGVAFTQTTAMPTMGTSSIVFVQFGGATIYTAGTGLTLSGSQFSLVTPVDAANGGTGVSNSFNITVGGALTTAGPLITSGANSLTLTTTGTTNVTLPLSGTLVNTSVATLSSLTSVGTITTGTWNGTVVTGTYGGTGINNGANTITLGGNINTASSFTTSGANALTLTTTGATNVTLPTTGTLVNTAVATLSSLTSIGTITTGTWNGTVIGPTYGGTGVNNGASTITLAANFATSGANSLTLTTTGATNVTLPTTGTLVNSAVATLSSLTSIGTITTGTWNGTAITAVNGGTGNTVYAVGDLLFANTTSTLSRLADVATGQVLVSGGVGVAPAYSANPTLTGLTLSGLTASQAVVTNGSNALISLSYTAAATASTLMSRDTNANTTVANLIEGYATTATAAGTTVLTVASVQQQYFTGSTTQTVRLPVTTTLVNGQKYIIVNNSTGVVSIQTGGAAAITTVPANTSNTFTCINNGSDVAASWSYTGVAASLGSVTGVLLPANGGTGVSNSNANTITVGGVVNIGAAFTTSANPLTLTTSGSTNVTLPLSGTLVNSAVATLSSLTSVGTISTGTWNASVVQPTYGGTGVNNGANTITLGGSMSIAAAFTTSGANALTITTTAATNVTLPTTGTLVNTAVATLSSLTSIGTITTGTWNATIVGPTYGGTGVNNGASTITLAANFATSGANSLTLTTTGATNVTLPTTGTLVNSAVATLSSLTSIGTITTGTWNGTTISAVNGGTGNTVYAIGDLLFANTTSTLSRLADVATGQVLVSGGVGVAPAYSANPTLTGLTLSGLTASQAVVTNGSNALASLSYTAAATASTLMSRDSNANTTVANLIDGYATTATAAGTTVLSVASFQQQYFTGSTTQTVRLPVTTTLVNGQKYIIVNNSTGVVSIQTGGAAAITTVPANTTNTFTCINNGSDVAASWSYTGVAASLGSVTGVLLPANGGTGIANSNANTITVGGAVSIGAAFTTSANALTLTTTGATNVTLPTSGTLVNSTVATLSSLTSIGTITTGTWNGSVVTPTYGGTGVNNGASTITLAANFATSGANTLTLTTTGATNVTLPTSGTLVNSAVATLSSLTSIGTITTGTWNGTTIAAVNGGTGNTVYAVGDLLFANTTSTLSRLADVATGQVLVSGGVGVAPAYSANPTLTGLTLSGLTASQAVVTNGSNALISLSYTSAATASTLMSRDANANTTVANLIDGYATTATAAGTTVLTVASVQQQYFTGSTTQTVRLPVTTTLVNGQKYIIVNNSTGVVSIQTGGAAAITTVPANTSNTFTCINNGSDVAASWSYTGVAASLASVTGILQPVSGGTGVSNSNANTITVGGAVSIGAAFTTSANALTLTTTGATNVTLPTSGTLVNSAVATLSSLTSIGTITTGTWNGSVVTPTYGGTGVNNGASTITLAANFATSGANTLTLTTTGATNVTLPTTGTLVNSAVATLSSLTSIGTITTGTWNGSVVTPTYGGTGVNNGASTITLAANFATSGANSLTLTTTGATNVTLPTTGTLVNSAVATLSSLTSIGTITTGTWNGTTVAAGFGGTGSTAAFTTGGVAYGMSASVMSTTAAGTSGQVLQSAGTGAPTWTSTPTFSSATISSGGNITVSGGGTITGLPTTPVNPTDAASKAYVDSATAGLSWKATAAYATAAALPSNTYSNGASGVGATLTATANGILTVDGTALSVVGTRVLVKNEAAAANNGIYQLSTVGTAGVPYVLTRTTDGDLSSELNNAALFVTNGSANMGVAFTQTTAMPTMGTSSIVFVQFGGATIYTAGTGLTLSGAQFSLVTPVTAANGGTGVSNSFNITVGGALTTAGPLITSGANSLTLTTTAATNVTLPTSGTLVNSSVATLSSLTSVGTITTGTWNGTAIAAANGGTGNTVYAVGDLLFANTTSTLARLADVATGSALTSGGVGVAPLWTAFTNNATVSTLMSRDANGNTRINNLIEGYTTTATAAGTTVLSVTSTFFQYFTGATTQTVRLPVTTTLVNGQQYQFVNTSTGALSIQTGGAAAITTVPAGTSMIFTCINNGSDVAASWNFTAPAVGTVGTTLTLTGLTANSFLYSGTGGLLTTTAAPTNGQILIGATGAAPTVRSVSGDITLSATGVVNVISVDSLPINATTGVNSSIFFGYSATVPTSLQSIGIGYQALNASTGTQNTAVGYQSMLSNVTGTQNVGVGVSSLLNNYSTSNNVGVGYQALQESTYTTGTAFQATTVITGVGTTFTPAMVGGTIVYAGGAQTTITAYVSATSLTAGTSQTVSSTPGVAFTIYFNAAHNTAIGSGALINGACRASVAVGSGALPAATFPTYSVGTAGTGGVSSTTVTGVGTAWFSAMASGSGSYIVFTGGVVGIITSFVSATQVTLSSAVTVANGTSYVIYLNSNTAGNTSIGQNSGASIVNGLYNTLLGFSANTGASTYSAIAIGNGATATSDQSIALGQGITANQTGGFFVQHRGPLSISVNGVGFIAGTNELVELTSSRRFKQDIRDLESVSEKFGKLRPVRFTPKEGHGMLGEEHIGLIAEEVEELFPEFATHDQQGQTTGIMYDRMIAVLIKEMLAMREEAQLMKEELRQLKL